MSKFNAVARVVVRPIATPLPLGLPGLFAATMGCRALQLGRRVRKQL